MTPFDPGLNQTIAQANATSSAGGSLPDSAGVVVLSNSSATAIAYFVCTPTVTGGSTLAAVVPVGSTKGSLPILPGQQIRVTVPEGPKTYRTIASEADGTLFITPGRGN